MPRTSKQRTDGAKQDAAAPQAGKQAASKAAEKPDPQKLYLDALRNGASRDGALAQTGASDKDYRKWRGSGHFRAKEARAERQAESDVDEALYAAASSGNVQAILAWTERRKHQKAEDARKADGVVSKVTTRKRKAKALEKLTFKQRLFAMAYIGEAKMCATKAAEIAGYTSPEKYGSDLLRNPNVQAVITSRIDRAAMSAEEVLSRLAEHARSSMADFLTFDQDGRASIDLSRADDADKLHLVRELTHDLKTGQIKVKLQDQQNALVQLGRAHKLFTDRVETEMRTQMIVRIPMKATPEEWAAAAARARDHAEERAGTDEAEK